MKPEELELLLAEFIERRDSGEALEPNAFCAEHPEGGEPLREALLALAGTDAMLPGEALHPERIGPWRVLGPVSRGGMGAVLRVVHEGGGPQRALKLLSDASLLNERARTRLRREGEALMQLAEPGIVRCHEVGFSGDVPYLVMDLVRGQSLAELVRAAREGSGEPLCGRVQLGSGGGDPFQRTARVVAILARSVAGLHETGLLHRDIKPANVVFDETTDQPVLLDFGLVGGEELATLTKSGDVVGTPAYMAPEQARGERVGTAADIFGLGSVLFELLTLQPPRQGEGSWSVLEEVRSRPVRNVQKLAPNVPKSLARIADKALAWHPRWRYATAIALAEDLDTYALGGVPAVRGATLSQRIGEIWEFQRSWVIGAAVAAVLVPTLWVALNGGPDPAQVNARTAAVLDGVVDNKGGDFESALVALEELVPQHRLVRTLRALSDQSRVAGLSDSEKALLAGIRSVRAGKAKPAVADLERANQLNPNAPSVVLLLGVALFLDRDHARARRELVSATRLLPESATAHRMLARTLRRLREFEDAERALARAFELSQPTVELLLERSRLHRAHGRFDLGLVAAVQGLKLAGATPPRELLNVKGILLDQLNRRDEATAVFKELARRFPAYEGAIYNQALVADKECRLADAARLYQQACRANPESINALTGLAWLHSGSDQTNCAKCRAAFVESPRLLSKDRAEEHLLRAVRVSLGRSTKTLSTAITIAKRIGRRGRLRDLMIELRDRPGISNSRYGRLSRMLKVLDK